MSKKLKIYPAGTKVEVAFGTEGTVLAATIRENNYVTYEVTYWSKSEYKTVYLTAVEVKDMMVDSTEKKKSIGFKS